MLALRRSDPYRRRTTVPAAQFETPAAMKATCLDMRQIETIRAAQNDVLGGSFKFIDH